MTWGLPRFSRSENGTVPFRNAATPSRWGSSSEEPVVRRPTVGPTDTVRYNNVMISLAKIDCRVVLRPGVTPSQRLALMEVVEKWALALTSTKPSKFVADSNIILFVVNIDRDTALETLRGCLPDELVEDVFLNGVSWNQ